jgi:hypothetical protein
MVLRESYRDGAWEVLCGGHLGDLDGVDAGHRLPAKGLVAPPVHVLEHERLGVMDQALEHLARVLLHGLVGGQLRVEAAKEG